MCFVSEWHSLIEVRNTDFSMVYSFSHLGGLEVVMCGLPLRGGVDSSLFYEGSRGSVGFDDFRGRLARKNALPFFFRLNGDDADDCGGPMLEHFFNAVLEGDGGGRAARTGALELKKDDAIDKALVRQITAIVLD